MRELNHLMTFESFTAQNEEFNPFKKDDWTEAGHSIRRGVGFLTPEEEKEKGKKLVLTHPMRKKAYEQLLKEDPLKAEAYLRFWVKSPEGNPVWDKAKRVFVDRAKYYAPAGSIGAGN